MPKNKKSGKSKKASKKTSTKKIDVSKMEKDTRVVPIEEWDWSRVHYSEPQKQEIPDGSGHYRRVYINYRYDDKTIGPAIVELSKHYCFGVQPDNTDKDGKVLKDKETGRDKPLRGYKMPIVMTSQSKDKPDNVTEEEQREVDFIDDWRNEVVRYAVENKKAIGKGAKNEAQLDGMVGDLLYRKRNDDGEPVEGVSPKFYANLKYYSRNKEFGTTFYGPGDKELHPLSLTGHFHVYPTIHFDNIFVGGKTISLQARVYDATVEPIRKAPKKRLARRNNMEEEEGDAEALNEGGDYDEASEEGNDPNDMMESESDDSDSE